MASCKRLIRPVHHWQVGSSTLRNIDSVQCPSFTQWWLMLQLYMLGGAKQVLSPHRPLYIVKRHHASQQYHKSFPTQQSEISNVCFMNIITPWGFNSMLMPDAMNDADSQVCLTREEGSALCTMLTVVLISLADQLMGFEPHACRFIWISQAWHHSRHSHWESQSYLYTWLFLFSDPTRCCLWCLSTVDAVNDRSPLWENSSELTHCSSCQRFTAWTTVRSASLQSAGDSQLRTLSLCRQPYFGSEALIQS